MKAALIGYGTIGKLVYDELGADCVCVIAPNGPDLMNNLYEYDKDIDVIIDFSVPVNLNMISSYAKEHKTPVVIATTGFTKEQRDEILKLSKVVPVLKSTNFSIGSILMNKFLKEASKLLSDDFDIEVIEKNQAKKDKRSYYMTEGIIDILKEETSLNPKYDRNGESSRPGKEIGVHIIKGGNLQSSHEVVYCGENEILSISHTELSHNQFAKGAKEAAYWLLDKKPGLYTMENLIYEKLNN